MSTPTPPPWQQQSGQPYPGYPPPAAPKKRSWIRRHKILTTLGGGVALLFVFGLIGAIAGGGTSAPSGGGTASDAGAGQAESSGEEPAVAKVGTAARDGKLEFTVTKVRCGVPSVGPKDFGQAAQGQYCLVTVKAENVGDETQTLDASSQHAYDTAGRKLDADGAAGLYANPAGGGAFLNAINPGNAATAVLVFDVPKSSKLTRLELHDSPFSGGVEVRLA